MDKKFILRDVCESDLSIFFEQQLQPEGRHMAAFGNYYTEEKPFREQWKKMLNDEYIVAKTIVVGEKIVGHVLSYVEKSDKHMASYWIGREYWGEGFASTALATFVAESNKTRPIYARVAKDNIGSRRVLEKCGFEVVEESIGFASMRNKKLPELLFKLQ
ncbi:GNAT family N-acetyltransferase [Candidatus Uabimicrobium amorphum]|uniref:N-acetyltransferase n=1 Tax=Uabimicrobium amorphum TaxID=2596890 RepID=A0A5S9IP78_UABAM|nr:GNAT family N-acetyltransferase [Candidatus Uabimicrobium amorphum]BBM84650.1 N-acetyltransferase [Candidatus Uabimicrobium amorphum]